MKKQQWLGSGMLLLAAIIWGCAFVAQSVAMEHIGPFTFGGLRFALGGLALLPVIALRKKQGLPSGKTRDLLLGGVLCGGCLFFASAAQQIGLIYTTVGKSGFITALYVVLVPVAGLLFFRRRVSPLLILSVVAAVGGLYLLCGQTGFTLNQGDVYTFLCAILFTGHIMTVDSFVERVDGMQLSCVQFFVCAALNGVAALITEPPVTLPMITASWLPLAYTG
ncbi:MAG: DMT family transporter, partial [Clostridia bacterium]|nr:DMT family transporter [Clostridia bacterium]